eukprot:scaffold869_cov105-Isochrysis_galbana.AAC.25
MRLAACGAGQVALRTSRHRRRPDRPQCVARRTPPPPGQLAPPRPPSSRPIRCSPYMRLPAPSRPHPLPPLPSPTPSPQAPPPSPPPPLPLAWRPQAVLRGYPRPPNTANCCRPPPPTRRTQTAPQCQLAVRLHWRCSVCGPPVNGRASRPCRRSSRVDARLKGWESGEARVWVDRKTQTRVREEPSDVGKWEEA